MKKFLSLVMALVMTMSLVTIGAGATKYQDLTDKSEIQYDEAVAVLNKLGVISGYEDGSFRPTGALTRGAAAKIIVSLMIGPEAANALTVATAPYSDVPVDNTFAAVISYCKTAGYINGYTDGTFRPAAALTGYAFTKMLLGALGYSGAQEGFSGSGWTMNVARLGSYAGLFDGIRDFAGNNGVDRQTACQLALNTLKGTLVEYTGGTNVTSGDTNVTVNPTRSYITSNNKEINQNIGHATYGTGNNAEYTLEFGEQHFQDLKLTKEGSDIDDYGRPSNTWTYKKAEIGTFALTPDFTYTNTASGDTASDKVRDMGIRGYKVVDGSDSTEVFVNGYSTGAAPANLTDIPSYLGKGTLVELYIDDANAELITHMVVINTYIMQVRRVTSDYVSLKAVDNSIPGTWTINNIEDDDESWTVVKDLKVDDYVLVTPVHDSGNRYDAGVVTIPQTVSGAVSSVKLDGSTTTGVTVGGTAYNLAKNWTAEDTNTGVTITATAPVVGRRVTSGNASDKLSTGSISNSENTVLYLDNYGYPIYARNVQSSSDFMVYDRTTSRIVGDEIHYFAAGYDMDGNSVSLDFGTNTSDLSGLYDGRVIAYKLDDTNGGDYRTDTTPGLVRSTTLAAGLNASANALNGVNFDSGVKFVFLSNSNAGSFAAGTGDLAGVTVRNGVQKLDAGVAVVYTCDLGDDNAVGGAGSNADKITNVIVLDDSNVELSTSVMYVSEVTGQTRVDGKSVSVVTAYIDGDEVENLVMNKLVTANAFYRYTENEGTYNVSNWTSTSSSVSVLTGMTLVSGDISNKYITSFNGSALNTPAVGLTNIDALAANNAVVIDLVTSDGVDYGTIGDMSDALANGDRASFNVSIQFNGSDGNNSGRVAYIYITAQA